MSCMDDPNVYHIGPADNKGIALIAPVRGQMVQTVKKKNMNVTNLRGKAAD